MIVLYVDDEPDLLEIGKAFLEMNDSLTVDTADSVEKAIERMKEKKYDAIVSDYQMPVTDGIKFLKQLSVGPPEKRIPFILFTGRARKEILEEAIDNGAHSYVQKGSDIGAQFKELFHRIKQAIEEKRTEQSLQEAEKRLKVLSAIINYDIGDVMTALLGYTKLLKENPSIAPDHMIEMEKAVYALREYLNDVETYREVESKNLEWHNFGGLIDRCAKKCPDFTFINNVGNLKILTSRLFLDKVIHTLVDNTKRHGKKATTITINCEEKNNTLHLIYEDDGMGICIENKEMIFRHNFGDNKGSGLFLVKELFNITRASIVENGKCGKGVRFEIVLPEGSYLLE